MDQESIHPYPEPRGPFPSNEPIEPFEENSLPPFALSFERAKEELLFFLEELELAIKNISLLDRGEEKVWSERFDELRKTLSNFAEGNKLAKKLEHIELEFEKLKNHPFPRLQQSLLKEIATLQESINR